MPGGGLYARGAYSEGGAYMLVNTVMACIDKGIDDVSCYEGIGASKERRRHISDLRQGPT